MILYNSIGKGYNRTRQADPRIVRKIISLLDLTPGKTIADIGAGTGNYSNAIAELGYQVIAIEPATMMRSQAQPHPNVKWLTAKAEQIPLANSAVDAAIIMLALHHFSDLATAITEVNRIVGTGNIVIFAFEQSKIPDFWLTDYFPYFIRDTLATFPSTQTIAEDINKITQKYVQVIPFLLPADLTDLLAAAGWCKPEIYLDADVRNGISSFSKMPQAELSTGIEKLREDLNSGVWDHKYGALREQNHYDAGYRIIVAKNK
jgi:ubiquinone/menaquinone biosynthesis C-methylase UbiE